MEWCKLYANLPDEVRVQAAEAEAPGAAWLLMESICYLTRAESGGYIPPTQVEKFGGGARLKHRVAALASRQIWIAEADGGYMLDPELWSEERNLSDAAEKKKQADRERIAAKRRAEREAREAAAADPVAAAADPVAAAADPVADVSPDMSRDSRATCRATGDGDSRTPEKRREEQPPDVVSHHQVADAHADDDDDHLVTWVTQRATAKAGFPVTPPQARAIIATAQARAAKSRRTVTDLAAYTGTMIDNEPDIWTLTGPAFLPFTVIAPTGSPPGHKYEHNPATGMCGTCRAPDVDKAHRVRRPA